MGLYPGGVFRPAFLQKSSRLITTVVRVMPGVEADGETLRGSAEGNHKSHRDRLRGTGPRAQLPDRGVTATQALAAWAPSEGTAAQSVGKCSRHIGPAFSQGSTSPDTHLSARISPL